MNLRSKATTAHTRAKRPTQPREVRNPKIKDAHLMAEKTGRNTRTVLLVRCAAMIVSLCCLTLPSRAEAQDAEVGEPVQPAPEIRLTGVLAAEQEPAPAAFPALSLWIDGTRWHLQV